MPRYQVKSHVTYSEAAWTTGKVSEVLTETVPFRIRVILRSARHRSITDGSLHTARNIRLFPFHYFTTIRDSSGRWLLWFDPFPGELQPAASIGAPTHPFLTARVREPARAARKPLGYPRPCASLAEASFSIRSESPPSAAQTQTQTDRAAPGLLHRPPSGLSAAHRAD